MGRGIVIGFLRPKRLLPLYFSRGTYPPLDAAAHSLLPCLQTDACRRGRHLEGCGQEEGHAGHGRGPACFPPRC